MYVFMHVRITMCILTDNDETLLKLHLVGGSNEKKGDVEILFYGVWGYVCYLSSSFHLNNANVACRQLGFPGAVEASSPFQHSTTARLWLNNVQCFGNESGLEHCSHEGFGKSNHCNFYHKLAVVCIGA